jgi:hypothetical protein
MVAGCKQRMAAGELHLCVNLTCYGKQYRYFEFLAIWRTRAEIIN